MICKCGQKGIHKCPETFEKKPTLTEWLEGKSKIELKDNRYVQAYKQALSDIEDKIKAGEFSGL